MPIPEFTWPTASCQVASGGGAGLLEVLVNHPLDVVKTRMQLQGLKCHHGEILYHGVIDCFVKIYRNEGVGGLYKGLLPPIICETPKRAFKFLLFEQFQRFFMFGEQTRSTMTYALAGALAGTMECFVLNPFEVVKITQQANRLESASALSVAKEIVHKDGFGIKGLNRGLTATMARNAVFHFVFFGFYYGMKTTLPPSDTAFSELLRRTALGFVAGVLGVLYSAPLDMAKSRIQGPQPIPGQLKYVWTIPTVGMVYQEEGFRALYKGAYPSLLRVGPGGAIILLAYEYGYEFCLSKLL